LRLRLTVNMAIFKTLAFALSLATAALTAPNGTTPMQIRLAYAGPTGMMVSWNTYEKLANPTVYYGSYVYSQPGSRNVR